MTMTRITPKGLVQKLVIVPFAHTEYRKRSEELFSEHEWSWTSNRDEAHEFESYELAALHASELNAPEDRDAYAVVPGDADESAEEKGRRLRRMREAQLETSGRLIG